MAAVLIVEDDPLIAWSLGGIISDGIGADVVIATSLAGAEEELSRKFDFALLDVNIKDDTTFALARRLSCEGVPLAFASGACSTIIPDDLNAVPFLQKPCRSQVVINTNSERASLIAPSHQKRGSQGGGGCAKRRIKSFLKLPRRPRAAL